MTGKEEMTVLKKNPRTSALCLICALVFILVSGIQSAAAESGVLYSNPQTGYTVYIEDSQDLLTSDEESSLVEVMMPLTEYGHAGFVSCSSEGMTTKSYAAGKYSSVFGSASGTMLVIDMGNRELYIKNNGQISKVITNAYSNTISDNIFQYAARGDYYSCASSCFSQLLTLLEGGRIAQPMRYITAALLALILGLTINFLLLLLVTRPKKADSQDIIDAAKVDFILRNPGTQLDHSTRTYSPRSSGSSGGGSRSGGGGGGFSGGGGSGGGHRF